MQLFICKFNLLEGACSKDPLKREDIINFLFSVFVIVIKKTGYYQSLSKKYQNMIKIQHYLFLLNYCNGIARQSRSPVFTQWPHQLQTMQKKNIIIGVSNPDDWCTQDCPGGNPEGNRLDDKVAVYDWLGRQLKTKWPLWQDMDKKTTWWRWWFQCETMFTNY